MLFYSFPPSKIRLDFRGKVVQTIVAAVLVPFDLGLRLVHVCLAILQISSLKLIMWQIHGNGEERKNSFSVIVVLIEDSIRPN
jgi:hypothetical protein